LQIEKAVANLQIEQHFIRAFDQKKKCEKKMGELKKVSNNYRVVTLPFGRGLA
jgi:hypothetical protein